MTATTTRVNNDGPTGVDIVADRERIRRARTAGRGRAVTVSIVLVAIGFAIFCVSISVGDFPIPLGDVIPAVFGFSGSDSSFIIHDLRLPRALAAVLVGGAFGLSGTVFQSLGRNPLASPDIIGITAGASASAVFIIVVLHGSGATVSIGALIGALITALVIYLLAFKGRSVTPYRLILVGIGVASVLASVTSYLLVRAEITTTRRATVWLAGSLNNRTWSDVGPLTAAMAVLVPAMILLTRPLRALQLGDDTAKGLGVSVESSRVALVFVGVALAAAATAAAGPIAFVAFMAPPIARRLVGATLTVIPAALTGAVLVLVSDVIARRLFAPTQLPVGVITGIIGGPYLVYLLARANRVGSGG